MHPLNIPELAFLIKLLKNHEGEAYDAMGKLEGEERVKSDELLFKLLMNSSFEPVARIYNFNNYRNRKEKKGV
ncbi:MULTISPECIES: hypothetical protein [Thermodesulfovibrio]|jgi:hypothetical protein|uniref:hypothetical protein n=1 Tax=Thermodesulfovibrio TaxID=28261 RepID=UPI0004254FA9|nr:MULTISPECIES: hypothetical protein [Thermodesulfovibrio]